MLTAHLPAHQDQPLHVAHLREADVGRDPVSNGQGHDVSWNQVSGEHVLELAIPQAVWEKQQNGEPHRTPFDNWI